MTGELAQLIFQREELITHIKEKELDRIENDIRNVDKYNYLYDILYALDEIIAEKEQEEDYECLAEEN